MACKTVFVHLYSTLYNKVPPFEAGSTVQDGVSLVKVSEGSLAQYLLSTRMALERLRGPLIG